MAEKMEKTKKKSKDSTLKGYYKDGACTPQSGPSGAKKKAIKKEKDEAKPRGRPKKLKTDEIDESEWIRALENFLNGEVLPKVAKLVLDEQKDDSQPKKRRSRRDLELLQEEADKLTSNNSKSEDRSLRKKNVDYKKFFSSKKNEDSSDEYQEENVVDSSSEEEIPKEKPLSKREQKKLEKQKMEEVLKNIREQGWSDDDEEGIVQQQPVLSEPSQSDSDSAKEDAVKFSTSSSSDSEATKAEKARIEQEEKKKKKRLKAKLKRKKKKAQDMPALDFGLGEPTPLIPLNTKTPGKIQKDQKEKKQSTELAVSGTNEAVVEKMEVLQVKEPDLDTHKKVESEKATKESKKSESSSSSSSSSGSASEGESSTPDSSMIPTNQEPLANHNVVQTFFGGLCPNYLVGSVCNQTCANNHQLLSVLEFQQRLKALPQESMQTLTDFLGTQRHLFSTYCPALCVVFGERGFLDQLKHLIGICEQFLLFQYYQYIVNGMKMCENVTEFYALKMLLEKQKSTNFEALDTLLEFVSYMQTYIPRFTKFIQKYASVPYYEFPLDVLKSFVKTTVDFKLMDPNWIKFLGQYLEEHEDQREDLDQQYFAALMKLA